MSISAASSSSASTSCPGWRSGGRGVIINFSSPSAFTGGKFGATHYAASKAATIALSRGLATQFGKDGIRVNVLCPGTTDTPMIRDTLDEAQIGKVDRRCAARAAGAARGNRRRRAVPCQRSCKLRQRNGAHRRRRCLPASVAAADERQVRTAADHKGRREGRGSGRWHRLAGAQRAEPMSASRRDARRWRPPSSSATGPMRWPAASGHGAPSHGRLYRARHHQSLVLNRRARRRAGARRATATALSWATRSTARSGSAPWCAPS